MECRILDYNLCFQTNTGLSSSSSDPNFPVSNLQNFSRSKVWRSSGNFVIGATNNKIDFKISGGGSQLTGTVASGTYTPATLASAIVAAMAAQDGAHTYTVAYSPATGLWTIATSGAFLSLLWSSGSNNANDTGAAIGFTADQTGATSYTGAQIAIHTEEWILIDAGAGASVDTFTQFFDPLVGIPLSISAVVTIQGNATNVWTSPAVNQVLTIDRTYEVAPYFWNSAHNYRYWRLKIVDPQNTNLYVEVSKLALGLATQLSRIPQNGFDYSITDQSVISLTDYGHQYSDLYPERRMLKFSYAGLTSSDIQTLERIYRSVGMTTPIVVALDDTGTVFNANQFLLYSTFAGPLNPKHVLGQFFNQQITFQEVY